MQYRPLLLAVYLASLLGFTVQRHLLRRGSKLPAGQVLTRKLSIMPITAVYLIKKPLVKPGVKPMNKPAFKPVTKLMAKRRHDNQAMESANIEHFANADEKQSDQQEQPNDQQDQNNQQEQNNQEQNDQQQEKRNEKQESPAENQSQNQARVNDRPANILEQPGDASLPNDVNLPGVSHVYQMDSNPLVDDGYITNQIGDLMPPITPDDQLFARRLDELSLAPKLGGLTGLTGLTSLLTHSHRRISPLNKIILGLLGPKLIKLQLDMMFGAVVSELVRKLVMPVIGFVIDKNLPMTAVQNKMQPQVPNSYSNQIEQLQSAYASLTPATTASPATTANNVNYVNHPAYQSQTSSAGESIPYTYYGQAQLANYLASQPAPLTKSSQETVSTSVQQISPAQVTAGQSTKLTTEQISQQLNQLISQYANAINQQATSNQQASNQQTSSQSVNSQSVTSGQQSDQLSATQSELYRQLQGLILEQVKMKSQLQHLTKPRNYFAKEMQLLDDGKDEPYQSDEESSLRDASLNQIEQEYDRAQRWNSVLKNMDQFYTNETSSIK